LTLIFGAVLAGDLHQPHAILARDVAGMRVGDFATRERGSRLGPGDFVKVDFAGVLRKAPTEFRRTPLLAYGASFHGISVAARPTVSRVWRERSCRAIGELGAEQQQPPQHAARNAIARLSSRPGQVAWL
jgi:hypothetical protein